MVLPRDKVSGNDVLKDINMKPNYTVFVGGCEVNDNYLSLEDANKLAQEYLNDGYNDVVVVRND